MNVGEKKNVIVEPKDAFGDRDPRLIKIVPQKAFKDQNVTPRAGMIVDFSGMKGRIQTVSAGRITVDFNNPLAGKSLNYEIEIMEKIDDTPGKIKGVFEFFGFHDTPVEIENKTATVHIRIPPELKKKLSDIILNHIEGIDKIDFVESFEKKEEKKNESKEE